MKHEVVKIFDDLDALLDFCRIELLPFSPVDLYNRQSKIWQQYEASKRPRRFNNERRFDNRPRNNGYNNNNNNYRNSR
jgi:hypothetical protein